MILFDIIVLFINIFILIVSYSIMKKKFDQRYLNRMVLDNAKKELNNFMRSMNDTTLSNCSVIEVKVEELKKLIEDAEKKAHDLNFLLKTEYKKDTDSQNADVEISFGKREISPNNILESYRKKGNNNSAKLGTEQVTTLEKQMENMGVNEKIRFLRSKKMSDWEIRKLLSLSSGEFEVLLNVVNLDDKF